MSERLVLDIRRKRPALDRDAHKSRAAAIRLFCLECMGDSAHDVRRCPSPDCSLYPFRLGRGVDPAPSG